MSILSIEGLGYAYDNGRVPVLKNLNMTFEKGTTYAIVGKSGAGKTTLLSILSGLENAQSGAVLFNGADISKMNKEKYRSQQVGIVFQSFNLLPHLTALENVILSMDIAGVKVKDKKAAALDILDRVGLSEEMADRRVLKLSGGEQQRVAIARVLSYNPDVILADEPTGNLDNQTEEEVVDILKDLAAEDGKCVIIVTHSPSVSQRVDVIYQLNSLQKHKSKKSKTELTEA